MSETALEYLLGSATRPATLAALRDAGRLSSRRLEERVSASRRTLKRTLRTMESRGWVEPVGGAYELTALGAATLATYEQCRERERIAREIRPILEHAPASAFGLDIETLADATVIRPDSDPTAPLDRLLDLRAEASELREAAPFLLRDTVEQLADRVTAESPPDVTLVLEDAAPSPESYSGAYCDHFRDLLDAPTVDVRVVDDVSVTVGVADGHAFVGVAERDGMPGALLESDDDTVVDWANRSVDRYLDRGVPP
ncbi:helix-turn-helix transcriptional regulator [Haloplanus ruber]|uniref:Helix-turn-helix transcriptional regulator n=1 Tax=Haloplanus ruber TaxID=869892 RepID=A0ABD6CUB6_9EURY|nr:hypothetical protein [Haloplanus ruber]